ncbi:hypothetical protein BK816_08840 [Boudabousia tangfeifanii]|uniref:Fluoride-specific ion channel n=1 Tax=Boudabousia tangfeifanii TaxID=1912795 RepID=A0A1D9MMH6_9ACTO|nr:CrcB family protein [Boudabousia tangfeifanii]AOZ73363.1 hypothetical protein BK816_08840 [Boudabousia tangfeifanii]
MLKVLLITAIFGGFGAIARHYHSAGIEQRARQRNQLLGPVGHGTLGVNLIGSFLAGLVLGFPLMPMTIKLMLLSFLSGYTTFSTAMVDVVKAWSMGERSLALRYVYLMPLLCLLAVAFGFFLPIIFLAF